MSNECINVYELIKILKTCDPESKVILHHFVKHNHFAGQLESVNTCLKWDSINKRKLNDDEKPFVELNCYGVDKFGSRK